MSHESQNNSKENPFSVPFKSAFWLVIILVGLYIAGLNFVAVESGSGEGKSEATEIKTSGEKEAIKTGSVADPKKEEGAKGEEKNESRKEEKKEGEESEEKEKSGH